MLSNIRFFTIFIFIKSIHPLGPIKQVIHAIRTIQLHHCAQLSSPTRHTFKG